MVGTVSIEVAPSLIARVAISDGVVNDGVRITVPPSNRRESICLRVAENASGVVTRKRPPGCHCGLLLAMA